MSSVSVDILSDVVDALCLDKTSQQAWIDAKKRLKELALLPLNRIPTVVLVDVCELLRFSEPALFSKMSRIKHYALEACLAICTRICDENDGDNDEKFRFLRDNLCLISTLSDTLIFYLDKKCFGKDHKERQYALNYLLLAAKICRDIESERVQAFHLRLLPVLIDFLNVPKEGQQQMSNETRNDGDINDMEQTLTLARRYAMALFVSLIRKSPCVLSEALDTMSQRQLHSLFVNEEEDVRSSMLMHQLNFCLTQMALTSDSVLPQFVATLLAANKAGDVYQEAFKDEDCLTINMLADFVRDLRDALTTLDFGEEQQSEHLYDILSLMQILVETMETTESSKKNTLNSSFRLIRALLSFEETTTADALLLVAKVVTMHIEDNGVTIQNASEELMRLLDEIVIRLPLMKKGSLKDSEEAFDDLEAHIVLMLKPAVAEVSKLCFCKGEEQVTNSELFKTIITTLLHSLYIDELKQIVLDTMTPNRFLSTWRRIVSSSRIGDQPLIRSLLDLSHDLRPLSADWNRTYESITARPIDTSTWVDLLGCDVRHPEDKDAILRHVYSQSKSETNTLPKSSSSSSLIVRRELCLSANGRGVVDMREFEHILEKLKSALTSSSNNKKEDISSKSAASEVFALSEMMLQNERLKRRALTHYLSLADETARQKNIIIQTLESELETVRRVLMSTVHRMETMETTGSDFRRQVEDLKEEAERFKEQKSNEVESSNERLRRENADIISKARKYKEQVEKLQEINNEHFQVQEEFKLKLQEEVRSNTALSEGIEKRDQKIKTQEKQLQEIKGKMSKELDAAKKEVGTLSQICRKQEQSLAKKEKELQEKAEELKRIQSILKQIHS